MDFPGAALIGTVLAHNMKFATNFGKVAIDLSPLVNDVAWASIKDGGSDASARANELRAFLQHILPDKNWAVIGSAKESSENWGYSLQPEGFFRHTEPADGVAR